MDLGALQEQIRETYLSRDRQRGVDGTFRWLTEEVGELARAIRKGDRADLELEFSDVLAWTLSLANLLDVDVEQVAGRYADGCPKCTASPCRCAP
jgi:NTP pyrophosphatase (non-canonical NTP hydrolase)